MALRLCSNWLRIEIQEDLKNGSRKRKARNKKHEQLSNRFKPVHMMLKKVITILLYFWRKKHKKSEKGKAVERGRITPSHWRTLPDNLATYPTNLQRLPHHHHNHHHHHQTGESLIYLVCASIFFSRGANFTDQYGFPVLSLHLFPNHRALFTTTKTHYLGFIIQLAAIWIC